MHNDLESAGGAGHPQLTGRLGCMGMKSTPFKMR